MICIVQMHPLVSFVDFSIYPYEVLVTCSFLEAYELWNTLYLCFVLRMSFLNQSKTTVAQPSLWKSKKWSGQIWLSSISMKMFHPQETSESVWFHAVDARMQYKNNYFSAIAVISFSKEETLLKKAWIQTMVPLTETKHNLKCFCNACEITMTIWQLRANSRIFLLCKIISYLLLNCSEVGASSDLKCFWHVIKVVFTVSSFSLISKLAMGSFVTLKACVPTSIPVCSVLKHAKNK